MHLQCRINLPGADCIVIDHCAVEWWVRTRQSTINGKRGLECSLHSAYKFVLFLYSLHPFDLFCILLILLFTFNP